MGGWVGGRAGSQVNFKSLKFETFSFSLQGTASLGQY